MGGSDRGRLREVSDALYFLVSHFLFSCFHLLVFPCILPCISLYFLLSRPISCCISLYFALYFFVSPCIYLYFLVSPVIFPCIYTFPCISLHFLAQKLV